MTCIFVIGFTLIGLMIAIFIALISGAIIFWADEDE